MITSAACRAIVNGELNIFPVMRHADFFRWMKMLHCQYNKMEVEQGFIFWDEINYIEKFVSREEAYKIALNNGQLHGSTDTPGILFSEDIY